MKIVGIITFIVLCVLLIIVVSAIILFNLDDIYTPPALTPESIKAYNRCIEYIKYHDLPKRFICLLAFDYDDQIKHGVVKGKVYIGEICKMLSDPSVGVKRKLEARKEWDKRTRPKQQQLESEIKEIAHQLFSVGCVRFHRENDMVLFYKTYTPLIPLLISSPSGPGVIYSLSGENPNGVESEILEPYRPFIKIHGSWYMSRHLMLIGPRFKMNHMSTPKSLIDRSLSTKSIKFEEGKRQ